VHWESQFSPAEGHGNSQELRDAVRCHFSTNAPKVKIQLHISVMRVITPCEIGSRDSV